MLSELKVKGATSGRSIAINTILNLVGQLIPMAVGFVSIPILIRHLGTDRFAVITIAWMLIGYFSLFDMGLGRALTQLVAEKIGKNKYDDIPGIFWTSLTLMLSGSVVGVGVIALLVSPLVHSVLKVPPSIQSETLSALYILTFSIPFVTMTAALVGVLTACHRFDIINTIRIPMGTYSYAAPLMILAVSDSLVPIILALLLGRIVTFVIHLHYCFKTVPCLRTTITLQRDIVKPLFRFGGWMTISNIFGPFMVYFDRFLLGSVVSLTAVAYYTTPYEFITKLWIIPGALMSVLFPAFASTYTETPLHTAELFQRAVRYQVLAIFPVVFVVVVSAHQGITLWLGSSFADNSYRVLQWLAIGVFMNCLAQVPFSFLQGIGKPDVTSKLHVAEILLYFPALWFLVKSFGINGAAIAWSGRIAVDTALLFYATRNAFRPLSCLPPSTGYCAFAAIVSLMCVMILHDWHLNFFILALLLLLLMAAGWRILLSANERSYLLGKLSMMRLAK